MCGESNTRYPTSSLADGPSLSANCSGLHKLRRFTQMGYKLDNSPDIHKVGEEMQNSDFEVVTFDGHKERLVMTPVEEGERRKTKRRISPPNATNRSVKKVKGHQLSAGIAPSRTRP